MIGDRPLTELVPLYRDPRSDIPVTQFNMKWVELAGLVKFDFLGLKTLTVLARTLELLAARGVRARSVGIAARRPRRLRAAGARRHGRGVPSRRRRRARHAEKAAPGPVRGHHRRQRALPAGADGEHPALHRGQARRRGARLPAPGARGDPEGNLRRHDLPGAGHADRPGAGRLQPRQRRSVAPRDGQEDPGRDGGAAPAVFRGGGGARGRARPRRVDLRPDGQVCRLRLQQAACRSLRARRPIRPPI